MMLSTMALAGLPEKSNAQQPQKETLDQIVSQGPSQIQANKGFSKEVIVNGDYFIPYTQEADTLNFITSNPENKDFYLTMPNTEGSFIEFTNEIDQRERNSLEYLMNNGGKITLPNHTQLKGKDGNVLYITSEEKPNSLESYAVGLERNGQDTLSVRPVIAHFQEVPNDFQEEYNVLKEDSQRKDQIINALKHDAEVSDYKIEKQRSLLNEWQVQPSFAISPINPSDNLGYSAGLRATTPRGIGVFMDYGFTNTSSDEFEVETREQKPSNRPIQGEDVRLTTGENIEETYTLTGGIDFPVADGASLGILGGIRNTDYTTNATDEFWTERNGGTFNYQKDNMTMTDNQINPVAGMNMTLDLTDNISAFGQGTYTFDAKEIEALFGIRYNLTR